MNVKETIESRRAFRSLEKIEINDEELCFVKTHKPLILPVAFLPNSIIGLSKVDAKNIENMGPGGTEIEFVSPEMALALGYTLLSAITIKPEIQYGEMQTKLVSKTEVRFIPAGG